MRGEFALPINKYAFLRKELFFGHAVLLRFIFALLVASGLLAGRLLAGLSFLDFSIGDYRWDLSGVDAALYTLTGILLLYVVEPRIWRALIKSDEGKLQKLFFWHAIPVFAWILIDIIWQWGTPLFAMSAWAIWFFARVSAALRYSGLTESILARIDRLPNFVFIFAAIPFLWAGLVSSIWLTGAFILFFTALYAYCRDHFKAMAFECSVACAPLALAFLLPVHLGGRDIILVLCLLLFVAVLLTSPGLRKKEIRAYARVMWAVMILALIGAETTLEHTKYSGQFASRRFGKEMESDDVLFFVPKGFRPGVGGFEVRKFAFRSGEAKLEKPPGVFRVICVGGSSTYGKEVEDDQVWPYLLEKKLRDGGVDAQVVNAGVTGYSSFQILILLREYLLSYNPDVVLMYAGFNDMALSAGPYTMRELWEMMHGEASGLSSFVMGAQNILSRSIVYNALRFAIVGARRKIERSGKVIVANRHEFIRNVREINELCAQNGVRFLAMAEATQYDDFYYHTGLDELAKRRKIPFRDVYARFRRMPRADKWFADVVHLTPEGNRVVAEIAYDLLNESKALP